MNLQHVRAFCAIVDEGSFSRAAERLHLTQPTISAQVQSLERDVGSRLFERSAQGISLTAAGSVFHRYALQLMELVGRTEQAMDELQGLARGHVLLGASTVPGDYVLPPVLARFKQANPGLEVSLTVANSQHVRNDVRESKLELGLVGEQIRDERVRFEPIVTDRLVVAMRPEHPLAGRDSLTPAELLAQPMVVREWGSGTRATLERALAAAGHPSPEWNVFLELGSVEAVKTAVRAADAVAVLSEWSVRDEQRLGLLKTAAVEGVDLARELYLIRREHGYLSVAGEAFVTFLRSVLSGS
jgi:DNA-binding transcriptional LysR family regulator